MMRERAFDPALQRRLFSVEIDCPTGLPSPLGLPPGHFVCLVAWDARGASVEVVESLIAPLLRAGASYFVCWGPDCERVHDIVDELVCAPDNDFGVPEDACIMTTWHSNQTLREALWFFLATAWPDEHYDATTRTALAITVGSDAWAAEIGEALDHPREFVDRGPDDGDV